MRKSILLLMIGTGAPLLSGCAPPRAPVAGPQGVGALRVSITWPPRDRLIPAAANSIKVTVARGTEGLAFRVLNRPAGGGAASTTIEPLKVGALTVAAEAYPEAGAAGVAQARAVAAVQLGDGETLDVSLTMGSTIDRVEIAPASPGNLAVGGTVQLTATAKSAAGDTVLVAPGAFTWSTDKPAVATVDGTGKVTAVGPGGASITASESESGKSGSVSVVVGATSSIVNGDFSAGNTGFSTQYTHRPSGSLDQRQYAVGSNPRNHHHLPIGNFGDHTTGTGLMMILNGATTANVTVWEQTLAVPPNSSFSLSAWAAEWGGEAFQGYVDPNPARLEFFINGASVGTLNANAADGQWKQFSANWNSGSSSQATIRIVNQVIAPTGNDFSVDDIAFVQVPTP